MIIRIVEENKQTLHLVYAINGGIYLIFDSSHKDLNFFTIDESEIIDNYYSQYWIKYDCYDNIYMPKGWHNYIDIDKE
jgi:hypothetical protein